MKRFRFASPVHITLPLIAAAMVSMAWGHAAAALPVVGFDPGRIIDDSTFTNYTSMNAGQIQSFLNGMVPVCDTQGTQTSEFGGGTRAQWGTAHGYPPPYICLRDFAEGGRSAAQIIYDTAQQYRINPQVLIVLLQKEQGLVKDTWPISTQYRTATGYACPDSAPCDAQYFGLTNQLQWSAKMFRAIMDSSPTWYTPYILGNNVIQWNPNSACGNSTVNIINRATQALYNYTPYRPNQAALNAGYGTGDSCSSYGNRNFYLYFTDWFGPTVSGNYPSPLYKGDSDPTIYMISGNTKYPMANFDVINAFGLGGQPVSQASSSELSNYTTGPTITGTIAKKQDDPSGVLYLFDDGKRYPISIQDCKKYPDGSTIPNTTWGLDCFNSNVSYSLPNNLIDDFTTQDINLPDVMLYQNSAWKLQDGKKRRITDPVFIDLLGGWGNTRWMKDINATQPEGQLLIPDNSLVKFDNSPVIYLLTNALLYPIPGPDEFSAWGLGNRPIYSLPASFNASDPLDVSPTNLQFFAKDSNNTPYVLFNNTQKTSVAGNSYWSATTYSQLPDYVLNPIPTVGMPSVFRSTTGEIFIVQNDKKRPFPTIDDLVYSGYNPGAIQPASQLVTNKFTYDGGRLSAGRLFKVAGSNTIRYVYGEGASLQVNSSNIPGLPYDKLITVDSTTAAHYPIVGVY